MFDYELLSKNKSNIFKTGIHPFDSFFYRKTDFFNAQFFELFLDSFLISKLLLSTFADLNVF